MRVYSIAFHYAKGIAQHHICRLSRHSRKAEQIFHRMGYLAAKISYDTLAGSTDIFGLVAVEASRLDVLLQFFLTDSCEVINTTVLAEKVFRHYIDALVGTLRCKLRRNE